MSEKKNGTETILGIDIDFHTIIRDVLKDWWMILALAISVAMVSYVQVNKSYSPSYTIEAIYAVSARGVNNSVYNNLSTAQDTASRFSQILNSSTLRDKVAEELGGTNVGGNIKAEIIPETNLLSLKVTSDTPESAHRLLNAVMKTYPTISDYLVGDSVMDVMMEPIIPTEPDNSINVIHSVTLAFLGTILVLAAILAVFSYMKDTIRTSSDVEKKLDTKRIGTLYHEEKNKTFASKFRKNNSALLITNQMISFPYVETMQKLCHRILNRMDKNGDKTLLITSYLENEGKSTVAANVALSLVKSGKRVVLVDLDLRKPSQYKIFNMFGEEMESLGAILNGEKDIASNIIRQLDNGLYTIFNTREYSRSTEMLTAGKLEKILDFLKEKFDYVIIDTPPMAHVADTEEIANVVDVSLIVVREHMASAKNINDMIDILNNCKADPIGCVFNDAHRGIGGTIGSGYGYDYGYGYGKRYGYGGYYGKKGN